MRFIKEPDTLEADACKGAIMKRGEKLTYEQVRDRINEAVASVIDDAADTARLHNLVARGKVELDESDASCDTYLCIEGDEEE